MQVQENNQAPSTSEIYSGTTDHLRDELGKLDLMIQRYLKLAESRRSDQYVENENPVFRFGEYIEPAFKTSSGTGEALFENADISAEIDLLQKRIDNKSAASVSGGLFLGLHVLGRLFNLSSLDLQILVICMAPELNLKYEKIYGYLQDDLTKKRATVNLILELLCGESEERWQRRSSFSDGGPLMRARILQRASTVYNPDEAMELGSMLVADPQIVDFCLGRYRLNSAIRSVAWLTDPSADSEADPSSEDRVKNLVRVIEQHEHASHTDCTGLLLYLQNPDGADPQELARAVCRSRGCRLLTVDLALAIQRTTDLDAFLRTVFRDALLAQAMVLLDKAGDTLRDIPKVRMFLRSLDEALHDLGLAAFLAGDQPWPPSADLHHTVVHVVEIPATDPEYRQIIWERALAVHAPGSESWATELARRFRMTTQQIRHAAEDAGRHCAADGKGRTPALQDLYAASRRQSNQKLRDLAVKIEPRHQWNDIVLPREQITQLREICTQVRHRHTVFREWEFEKKFAHGKGLSVLFSGTSGTGKTMAAEIIARELGFDIYKIDLSGVVSKYIGETEKNLSSIFREAESSNAVLFFDEADALFGKRTKVSDAHDRYANIETSYLLQKIEEYDGTVILATNIRENMDQAFLRRLRFIVDFPFPDAELRELIWRGVFPAQAPLQGRIDMRLLAERFKLTGGNIKNIALHAAFLAAEQGGGISKKHVMNAVKREYQKMGSTMPHDLAMEEASEGSR